MHFILLEDAAEDCAWLASLLRENCARHGESVHFSCYSSGAELLSLYQPGCCDAIFLDILLRGGADVDSGLDTARKIRQQEPHLPIIFTTTEPDFALECYSVHPIDFLLKPLSPEKLDWCMDRLRETTATADAPPTVQLLETSSWGHTSPIDVPAGQIIYGQYSSHIMDVHTTLGVFCTRASFRTFAEQVPQDGSFIICSRCLIVNLAHVKRVGDGSLLLQNGEQLRFSRRRKQEIDRAFTNWAFDCVRKGVWI